MASNQTPASKQQTSKFHVELTGDMPGETVARLICQRLFEIMRRKESGILADNDSECLHDFRVAVRRTRALLAQLKGVLDKTVANQHAVAFKAIGKTTNRLRDTDVHLQHEVNFRNLVPDKYAADLDPFFQHLHQVRQHEHGALCEFLKGPKYAQLMIQWKSFLESECATAPKTQTPISRIARSRIRSCIRTVLKHGAAITPGCPDAQLHEVRIDCKNLRYLLGFFAPLFSAHDVKHVLRQLRRLQNCLGRFQDACVEMRDLDKFARTLLPDDDRSSRTLIAIGSLIGKLDVEKNHQRKQFDKRFKEFSETVDHVSLSRLLSVKS